MHVDCIDLSQSISKINTSVEVDKVELLYASTGIAFGAILVATLALYYLFSPVLDSWILKAWTVYMQGVGFTRIVVQYYYIN